MLFPRIETQRLNLPHLAFGEARGALDVLLRHGIGVRVARLADVVEEDLHASCGKNGMPLRSSTNSTAIADLHALARRSAPSAARRPRATRSPADTARPRRTAPAPREPRFRCKRRPLVMPPPESSRRPSRPTRPDSAPGPANAAPTARSPASPRICMTTSQICPTPVAPTGCPWL